MLGAAHKRVFEVVGDVTNCHIDIICNPGTLPRAKSLKTVSGKSLCDML